MKRLFKLFLFVILLPNGAKASTGDSLHYDIKITVEGIKTPKVLLGFYVGEQTYLVDSTLVDTSRGIFRFIPNRMLTQGMYFVANTEGILFDIILAEETNFSIKTKMAAPYDNFQIENSKENTVYFDYQKNMVKTQVEVRDLQAMTDMLKRAKADRESLNEQQVKIRDKYEQLNKYTQNLIAQNPSLFVSKLLKTLATPSVPSNVAPVLADRKPNPAYWSYFRQHFFDDIDFTDQRLLRSPFYTKRLAQFLGYMPPQVDSVKAELDFILEKARPNPDFFRFTLQWLTAVFDNNLDKMTNADAYLVHLVEKYHHYLDSGTDKYVLERLDYKVNAFKNALIGNAAPLFSLPNTEGVQKSLADINADFTVLIFYSSLCSHCRSAMPKIKEAMQYTDNTKLKIMAICTDAQREPWLAFIEEMHIKGWTNVLDTQLDSDIQKKYATWNLPVIYLLDKNKIILANRIKPEALPDLLRELFK